VTNNCGVYKITNTVTGDFYIGSSVDICRRFKQHRNRLIKDSHENAHLQRSWNKHGETCFEFSICEHCEQEQLIMREQFYIDNEKPTYNIFPSASGFYLGFKHSEESKRRISEAQMGERNPNFGKHMSEEQKRKISERMSGERHHSYGKRKNPPKPKRTSKYCHSEETRLKMSVTHTGCHLSEETRKRMSEAKSGERHPMFGKKHSEESIRKMSEAKIGKPNGRLGAHILDSLAVKADA
jgi:group I intron endonuclease